MAKLGVLFKVFFVYPTLTVSETVYHEVVTSGLASGVKDAAEVDKFYRSKQIVIFPSKEIKEYLEEIKRRRDIRISPRLCQKLIAALEAGVL